MQYTSTRDSSVRFTASQAITQGLSADGGLLTPYYIPKLPGNALDELKDMPYQARAVYVMKQFLEEFTVKELTDFAAAAYGPEKFDTPAVAPVHTLNESTHCLELWHGPTCAFKDMALQMLPHLLTASLTKTEEFRTVCILVATSGDTGKGALEGFKDVKGTRILVFYPKDGVSAVQELQMVTQEGDNVGVASVIGNFDDAQTGVKRLFSDEALREELDKRGFFFSSANSINWGRVLPQIVYYVSAYCDLLRDEKIQPGQAINVCVPTGNFGNILAAYYAKRMGVPLGMLYCASNENRVLTDFINTGTYDISERPFVLTPSPSMDILVSSNLERQLFELTGRDAAAIAGWMADLRGQRRFRVDEETFARVRELFASDSIDNATCLDTIKRVFEQHGYLLDPHTAVAYQTAENLRGENPVLIASTAHWAKFGDNVYRALHGIEPGAPLPDDVAALSGCKLNELIARETGVDDIPHGLAELDALPIRFDEVIDGGTNDIEAAALRFLEHLDD